MIDLTRRSSGARHPGHFLPALIVMVALWLIGPVSGSASTLDSLLNDLGHEDFHIRQDATFRLLVDETVSPQDIADLYLRASTPEQKHRLIAIARHHVIRAVRIERYPDQDNGSIGILHRAVIAKHLPEINRPGIDVIHPFPGFPGYAYLQPGDLILSIDDQSLPEADNTDQLSDRFVSLVQKHHAGDSVRFGVWRDGETLQLTFPLVSVAALRAVYHVHDRSLQKPFLDEWNRFREKMLGESQPESNAGDTGDTDDADVPDEAP